MILAMSNKAQRLLYLKMFGKVTAAEIRAKEPDVRALATEFSSGFRLLTDLTELGTMEDDYVEALGEMMDFFKKNGLEMVVRIIPDSRKDIGLNILSIFHYGRAVRTVMCETMDEAFKLLKM